MTGFAGQTYPRTYPTEPQARMRSEFVLIGTVFPRPLAGNPQRNRAITPTARASCTARTPPIGRMQRPADSTIDSRKEGRVREGADGNLFQWLKPILIQDPITETRVSAERLGGVHDKCIPRYRQLGSECVGAPERLREQQTDKSEVARR